MTEELCVCPFCGEEIKSIAIKCKHCGEFLENKKDRKEKSDVHPKINVIEKQGFIGLIIIGLISIILSIFDDLDLSGNISKLSLWSLIFSIWLWIGFRKYLSNFGAVKLQGLIYWSISLEIVIGLLDMISEIENDTAVNILLIGFFIFLIPYLVIYIKIGNKLMHIQNDFVGLLKQLGISIIFTFPLTVLLMILYSFDESKEIMLILSIIDNIPILIMLMIFLKARKFVDK